MKKCRKEQLQTIATALDKKFRSYWKESAVACSKIERLKLHHKSVAFHAAKRMVKDLLGPREPGDLD